MNLSPFERNMRPTDEAVFYTEIDALNLIGQDRLAGRRAIYSNSAHRKHQIA